MPEDSETNNNEPSEHTRKREKHLHYYPEWFPINDHFSMYQRHPTPCAWSCIRSTCERNCDTACVWSHVIALFITIRAFVQFLRMPSESFLHEWEEKLVLSLTFFCSCLCFTFSVIFHTFYHHSENVFKRFLKLDMLGIVMGIKGPWIPWIYYSFYCESVFRNLYMSTVVLNACTTGWSLTRNRLMREEKAKERAIICVALLCMSFPGFAWIFYRDGFTGAMAIGHRWAFVGLFFGAIGVFLFCSKIPESLYSGNYDSMIGSHALFHVFSAICNWLAIATGMALQQHRLELGDVCPS